MGLWGVCLLGEIRLLVMLHGRVSPAWDAGRGRDKRATIMTTCKLSECVRAPRRGARECARRSERTGRPLERVVPGP